MAAQADDSNSPLPPIPAWLQNGFHRFLGPYLRRHFDSIAVDRDGPIVESQLADAPLIVYGNHPSWWDPLIAHYLNHRLLPTRQFRAPIDAIALEQYGVFRKLGFFGVQMNRRSGAAAFLKTAAAIAASHEDALWITPEGRFADVRDHSASLMPGVAHLCHRTPRGHAVAMAMEYVFWNERLPVCLIRFSRPISLAEGAGHSKEDWQSIIESNLRTTQTELAARAIARDPDAFKPLVTGKSGSGVVYDNFRRFKSWFTRSKFQARHEDRT